MKYAWIEANRGSYPLILMCELLSVSRSGLYDARRRQPAARDVENERIVKAVRRAQGKHRGRYGRRPCRCRR